MIRTIESIKAFGVFEDFRWPSNLPEFKQFNLIYGWNYSGKTTLSRVFRCFERKERHADFADANVQLKCADGKVHSLSAPDTAPAFRVFNSDFVRDNLSFDSGSAAPILVLGAEGIAKQETLKAKVAEREATLASKESSGRILGEIRSDIQKALTIYARDFIKTPLPVLNYDKTRFEPRVIECKADPESHLLSDEELSQCLSIYRSTDKKDALRPKHVQLSSVADAREAATALLARVVTANISIPRLKENPTIEGWVKSGRPLHRDKDTCQFCGQPLPSDLMVALAGHFSAEYEDLMADLDTLIVDIGSAREQKIVLDHESDFYAELSHRFAAEKGELEELLEARKSSLETLEKALVAKQTKAFSCVGCPAVQDPGLKIAAAIETINDLIEQHNQRTAEFDQKRRNALVMLEKHYAARFVLDEKYNEQLERVTELGRMFAALSVKLNELNEDIGTLEVALLEASKGAERINDLLAAYFGKDDLRIEVSADERFQIVRCGIVAKNLSEGEKTAIAFAHFITRVQDGRQPLGEMRVVIDDPISSLDANHLFNTYALIKTQLSGCRQLFIATHSFEFYNLIRDWVAEDEGTEHSKKPQAAWKKWGMFLIRRTDDRTAVLEEIPKELLKFKSEYHFLFSVLYHFDTARTSDFDCLLTLPNVVRRFLDAFGGVMIPLSRGLKSKMVRIFTDEIERERVWKFINHYSHNNSITRSLTIPDTSECATVVHSCLKAVQAWNGEYFHDLVTEVA